MAERACLEGINGLDAGRLQLAKIFPSEIYFSGAGFSKLPRDVFADLIAASADARPDGCGHPTRLRAELARHDGERFGHNVRGSTPPSGMDRGHGAPLAVRDEDGQAVRGPHRQSNAGAMRNERIAAAGAARPIRHQNNLRMDLLQARHPVL